RREVRLAVATSKDLRHWIKHGPVFAGTPFEHVHSKSGSIVSTVVGGRLLARKISGSYWMYWGDDGVKAASSADLIHWTPFTDSQGKIVDVLPPRQGYFDSNLAEGGPAAVLTKDGIVVLYNGMNSTDAGRDPDLPPGIYCGGQALFDAHDPLKLLKRPDKPFFEPEMPWEKTGQYKDGTTFIEGLVRFRDRWFLYYGCADSKVGVAVSEPARSPRSVRA
ncbi:MAG TPA: hypothetical protein VMI31_15290, partial [Fimbriimonadaceae bacterium]|nr:hypothetical protein [Fimbriimonadaceae bacterium]